MSISQPLSFMMQLNHTTRSNLSEILADNNFQEVNFQLNQQSLDYEDEWNFLYFVRLFFYLLVFLKMISLICFRKKKLDVRDRVYRKFLFSHSQMIRQFDEQDKQMMEVVLNNTVKNANLDKQPKLRTKMSNIRKSVNFYQQKNEYFQPKKYQDNKSNQSAPLIPLFNYNVQERQNKFQIIGIIQQKKSQVQERSQLIQRQVLSEDDFLNKNDLQKIQIVEPEESKWQKND